MSWSLKKSCFSIFSPDEFMTSGLSKSSWRSSLMITSHSGLGSCSSAMCSRASLSQDGKVLCKLFIPCLCPTGKNKHQVDNPLPFPSANTHSSNLQVLRMKLSFFTNMFPLKLFSVKLELEAASVSFLHGLFVLGLFSTQQSPNTWSTYSFSAVLSRVWHRGWRLLLADAQDQSGPFILLPSGSPFLRYRKWWG